MAVDPAFNQLHIYVCTMIELGNYALTNRAMSLFELCKQGLRDRVDDFPIARNVIDQYIAVKDPYAMPLVLKKTNYTDQFVDEINMLIGSILNDNDDIQSTFQKYFTLIKN